MLIIAAFNFVIDAILVMNEIVLSNPASQVIIIYKLGLASACTSIKRLNDKSRFHRAA